jgi:predicted methyltransferase
MIRAAEREEEPYMISRLLIAAIAVLAFAGACAPKGNASQSRNGASAESGAAVDAHAALDAAIAGAHRSADEKARDAYRHPKETLTFFGAEPGMTIVEVWPGGGWYTNILAPYLKRGGGVLYAAGLDPKSGARAAENVRAFEEKFAKNPDLYGQVKLTSLADAALAPAGSADMVLTFRNVHNWLASGTAEENFQKFFDALRPGGVLGVEEHRAKPEATAESEKATGYVREQTVIALAEAAGFEFEDSSEVNANPKDTKDHPFGVWTLPPVRRSSAVSGVVDPGFDRAKYDAIGESDRMTLKFRKPLGADGALLE